MANLLVVEDDADVADSLELVLEDAGHDVRLARDGKEALEKLDEAIPDAVLLDVEMPVLNGPDTAYQMFVTDAGKEKIPIVLLSGIADLRIVAQEVGTPYFQTKPCRVAALLALLDRVLLERRAPAPLVRPS